MLHISKGNEIGVSVFILNFTHGDSSGGGEASLKISTRNRDTPLDAIWYESSLVSYEYIFNEPPGLK